MLTTTALLATLAGTLRLLIGPLTATTLLVTTLLATLVLLATTLVLSALIGIIRHAWISFRKLPHGDNGRTLHKFRLNY